MLVGVQVWRSPPYTRMISADDPPLSDTVRMYDTLEVAFCAEYRTMGDRPGARRSRTLGTQRKHTLSSSAVELKPVPPLKMAKSGRAALLGGSTRPSGGDDDGTGSSDSGRGETLSAVAANRAREARRRMATRGDERGSISSK